MGIDVTDPAALRQYVEAAAKRLSVVVAEAGPADVDSVVRKVGRQQVRQTRPAPLGPLAQLAAARDVTSGTALQLRPGLRPGLRRTADRLTLEVIDSTISWPAQLHSALLVAVSSAPFRPSDLPGLDRDEQLVLARRLLREGVVIPVAPGHDVGRSAGD
jgi:hypothetical protein